jgi:hypothetical protein
VADRRRRAGEEMLRLRRTRVLVGHTSNRRIESPTTTRSRPYATDARRPAGA